MGSSILDQIVYSILDQIVYSILDQIVYRILDQIHFEANEIKCILRLSRYI